MAFLFVVSLGISSIPIFSCEYPSINDYFNHLSRAATLLWYYDDPTFSSYFLPNWKPLPNLAFDIWIFGLGRILPVAVAGKLFVAATFALLLSGVIFLHRCIFEKWSLWPFLALLLLYNRLLLTGYLNFLLGAALWLYALSFWVCLRGARAALRIPVLSIAALIIFFTHLAAFGLLVATIAVYELA